MVRRTAVDDMLTALLPMLSLGEVRARVVSIVAETPDTKTFLLQPNTHWRGARSGQFIRVRLEINGKRVERVYSLSSPGGTAQIAITVKRQPGGLVSNHLHTVVKAGDVLTISQAAGDFTLPDPTQQPLPTRMLLLSAGSGITPVMAMLRSLHAARYTGDLVFVHMCRSAEDLIFAAELEQLQAQMQGLTLVRHFTEHHGRLNPALLSALVPELAHRETWMCGPGAWMDAVHAYWATQSEASSLHSERFGSAPQLLAFAGAPAAVLCATTGKSFTTSGPDALLVQAERAGLAPKHGCRMGICASCQCTKSSGTVQNLVTGELSSAPNETIRLCISAARSDLTLAI
jgi:ferredoxin-NADP reductase